MEELKVKRTFFVPKGYQGYREPCIVVGEENCYVRISKCYHFVGDDTLYVAEVLDGKVNSMEEIDGDFDLIDDFTARELAKANSAYVYHLSKDVK